MRSKPKSLISELIAVEGSISWLLTLSETTVKWREVPTYELQILNERVKLMSEALDEIYLRLNKYEAA
jgi:hypothetical protein|tara:strand:+ start:6888 stop:7091 length:204 start_codon:yes stop_codon:yes gene_type:complete